MFPDLPAVVRGVAVPSGVPHQPWGQEETWKGALERARAVRERHPKAAYSVGIEGGVDDVAGALQAFAWVAVLATGKTGSSRTGRARTGVFELPVEVAELVREGLELGDADDRVFGRSGSKRNTGSIGLLTNGALDRTEYYAQAVVMALIPFRWPGLTWGPG